MSGEVTTIFEIFLAFIKLSIIHNTKGLPFNLFKTYEPGFIFSPLIGKIAKAFFFKLFLDKFDLIIFDLVDSIFSSLLLKLLPCFL